MEIKKQVINIIFDAGKGTVALASREAVTGEAFGALPRPGRSGYRFVGWQLDGNLIDEETILLAEEDITLVAQWEKSKTGRKKSVLKQQKIAIIVLAAVCVFLTVALLVVNDVFKREEYVLENTRTVDGVKVVDTYRIKYEDGKYQLFYENGAKVKTNLDGYYIVDGGNQYKVDPATGESYLYAPVDTEGNEVLGSNGLVLMFEQLQDKEIYSIEVNGAGHDPYCFYRDKDGTVRIKGMENSLVSYNQELFASLCVSSGYTISSKKLDSKSPDSTVPKINGRIDYSAFGLADEDNPTTFTITKAIKNDAGEYLPDETVKYTVKIGDRTLPGGGYYAQLVGRDTIYILPYTLEDTILQPIEALIKPQIVYPMSMATFLCVEDFLLGDVNMSNGKVEINPIVAFSFLDLPARDHTISSTKPYVAETEFMKGYDINDANASEMLSLFAEMEYIACKKLGITEEALREYNLDGNVHYIQFKSPVTDKSGYTTGYVTNKILISPKTEQGTYYIASLKDEEDASTVFYDMIVEVDQYYLSFLEWNLSDWYYPNFFTPSITTVPSMNFHINGKTYNFRLDNSWSYMFYEASDGTMKQVDLSAGTMSYDEKNGWIYRLNGTNHAVQTFDLSKGGYYFRIVNLQDGKNTVTYEPFDEYRFMIDRNGCQTLQVFREDANGNKQEYEYVLTSLSANGSLQRHRQYSLVYRDENRKDFSVMGKYSTDGKNGYVTDYYQHSYWKEVPVKTAEGTTYQWKRITFNNIAEGLILCDESGATDKVYEISIASKNLRVYCDQFAGGKAHINLLDYTLVYEYKTDKGTMKTVQLHALENFRQFYTNLVSYTIEGDIDEKAFAEQMNMSTQEYIELHKENADASFSFKVSDMAKNTNLYTVLTSSEDLASEKQFWEEHNNYDIVIRFYRYSDRKVMMTLELVEEYDENGNPLPDATKTVGKFYVLTTVLDMIEEDLGLLLDPSKNVPVPERS